MSLQSDIIMIISQQVDMSLQSDIILIISQQVDMSLQSDIILRLEWHVYLLTDNQNNVSNWSDMSTCWLIIRIMSDWSDMSTCWLIIRIMHIILIISQQVDMSLQSDTLFWLPVNR
jgi:hypothetical protein